MKRLGRILLRIFAALLVLTLAAAFAAFLIFSSSWFREKVRERIISEVESKTGAKVEVGQFDFDATTPYRPSQPIHPARERSRRRASPGSDRVGHGWPADHLRAGT